MYKEAYNVSSCCVCDDTAVFADGVCYFNSIHCVDITIL